MVGKYCKFILKGSKDYICGTIVNFIDGFFELTDFGVFMPAGFPQQLGQPIETYYLNKAEVYGFFPVEKQTN